MPKKEVAPPPTPICDRLSAARDKISMIREFLEWVEEDKKFILPIYERHNCESDECVEQMLKGEGKCPRYGDLEGVSYRWEDLLYEFFKIDQNKLLLFQALVMKELYQMIFGIIFNISLKF